MGLFSRKKKLSKEQRKDMESAKKILKNTKELQKRRDSEELARLENARKSNSETENPKFTTYKDENPEEYQKLLKQIEEDTKSREIARQKDQEEFNQHTENLKKRSHDTVDSETLEEQTTCSVLECGKEVDFFEGKKCKFCNNLYCFEHIQLEKHECVKPTLVRKHLRKTWLRKYDVNISSGRYIVVCDDCSFVSKYGSLIDIAGDERNNHIADTNCDSKKVWLEEDLSDYKIEKDIDLEQLVPTDRTFWVCAHCRPPQKFTDRTEYISHHYFHS